MEPQEEVTLSLQSTGFLSKSPPAASSSERFSMLHLGKSVTYIVEFQRLFPEQLPRSPICADPALYIPFSGTKCTDQKRDSIWTFHVGLFLLFVWLGREGFGGGDGGLLGFFGFLLFYHSREMQVSPKLLSRIYERK